MQIRVITLRYNEALHGFPEDAVRQATFGREVLSVSEHFFVFGNVPHLTLVLSLIAETNMQRADRPVAQATAASAVFDSPYSEEIR